MEFYLISDPYELTIAFRELSIIQSTLIELRMDPRIVFEESGIKYLLEMWDDNCDTIWDKNYICYEMGWHWIIDSGMESPNLA